MASSTCSPSSLQLRLALNCRKSRTGLVRSRARNLENRVRFLRLVGGDGRNVAAMQRRRSGTSWVFADSSEDNFSGWSNTNEVENDNDSQRKTWLGGLVGMGVAGIILVTGITVAAFSISSQNNSKHKPQLEVLTTQQEESLSSDMQDTNFAKEDNTRREKNGSLECESELDKDSYASPESEETPKENGLGNDSNSRALSLNDATNSSNGIDLTDSSFNQEYLLLETELADKSTTVGKSRSNNFPESELVGDLRNVSGSEDPYSNLSMASEEVNLDLEENPGVAEPNIPASKDILININDKDETHSLVVNHNSNSLVNTSYETHFLGGNHNSNALADSSSSSNRYTEKEEPVILDYSVNLQPNKVLESQDLLNNISFVASPSPKENFDMRNTEQVSVEVTRSSVGVLTSESGSFGTGSVSASQSEYILANGPGTNDPNLMYRNGSEASLPSNFFSSFGVPAPVISANSYAVPGKVLIPAFVDQVHGQALAALQVLKVIEADVQASDLCTRREYARWLVSASSALSRNTISKVYPAMYIENVTELAFDDITPEDPDFVSIQGLAEAGLISSKLSRRDMLSSSDEDQGPYYFFPESPLSRQDLVSWKMALEKKQLPVADRKMLHSVSGFIDVDKIHPDACPALVADLANGEQGIIALAFGYTRLFQPDKPVTKSQAAIALATGEASDIVGDEFARIEAESMAENAVTAHAALVAEVEKEINESFEKELAIEREKINLVEKMAEEARQELELLRSERERDKISQMKDRVAVDSEMEVLSKLRREVEEQLQSLMSNKVEISHDKEKISKLRKEVELENQEIARLQYELEVERKALSMARAWAEDEAKRAREQAKALEEARDKWERQGIKVVVDSELREQESAGVTWLDVGKKLSVEGTVNRAENLIDKLKGMAANVRGKSRDFINMLIQRIELLISKLRQWVHKSGKGVEDLRDSVFTRASRSSAELQQVAAELSSGLKEGTKRVVEDCRGGVEKFAQKFKA